MLFLVYRRGEAKTIAKFVGAPDQFQLILVAGRVIG